MKKISKESSERMCAALEYALKQVRNGTRLGLCSGVELAFIDGIISAVECDYLAQWIRRMLYSYAWLEDFMKIEGWKRNYPELRYQRRKLWVEWMIQHLKETTPL